MHTILINIWYKGTKLKVMVGTLVHGIIYICNTNLQHLVHMITNKALAMVGLSLDIQAVKNLVKDFNTWSFL